MFRSHSNSFLLVLVYYFSCVFWAAQAFTPNHHHYHSHSHPPSVAAWRRTTTPQPSRSPTFSTFTIFSGPAVLDRPETIEIIDVDKSTEQQEKIGGEAWEIRLYNDPFNKREFVARCLAEVCGKSDTESYQIMMEAHRNGMGLVGRYNFEIAELYHGSLRENGLMVDMVQVDDE
jgi:ATP-dependent Clp protease adapter protein ClpS